MDEIADLIGFDLSDPQAQLALDLAQEDRDLLISLVMLRKQKGLSQAQVGELLGVRQPTVQAFERLGNDPRLSTIRRFALAIGARVTHEVTLDNRLERTMIRQRDHESGTTAPKGLDRIVRAEMAGS